MLPALNRKPKRRQPSPQPRREPERYGLKENSCRV